jgi:sensor domain CHASE-containing protein
MTIDAAREHLSSGKGSFQNVILERNALRIGSDLARKDLQVIAVANLLAGVGRKSRLSLVPLELAAPPMLVFARRVKHPFDVVPASGTLVAIRVLDRSGPN